MDKQKIRDLAQHLTTGVKCYIHRKTLEVVTFPDPDELDKELLPMWSDDIKKVKKNRKDYIEIENMDSRRTFRVMEDFVETVDDARLKVRLMDALERSKPFRNFRSIIDNADDYREEWFRFSDAKLEEWVEEQLKDHGLIEREDEEESDEEGSTEIPSILLNNEASRGSVGLDPIIAVKDVRASADWYRKVFGFTNADGGDHFAVLTDNAGEVVLCLHAWERDNHPTMKDQSIPAGNGLLLYFRMENWRAVKRNLEGMKWKIEERVHKNPNSHKQEFSFRDPDGYFITVTEFHKYEG